MFELLIIFNTTHQETIAAGRSMCLQQETDTNGGGIVEIVGRQVRPENVSSGKERNGQLPNQTYCFGQMPNFLIREMRVLRLMPIRAAAPVAPPTRPLLSVSARSISSRCFLA